MERLTQWIEEDRAIPRVDMRRCGHERCTTQLARYEDTGLTPEQIMELKKPIKKLHEYFDELLSVGQVIDFFMDFYIAHGDPGRVEEAELLTNEDVTEYRRLKERDTAKPLMERHYEEPGEKPYIKYTCPNGCKIQPSRKSNFCSLCGQRLKWEE